MMCSGEPTMLCMRPIPYAFYRKTRSTRSVNPWPTVATYLGHPEGLRERGGKGLECWSNTCIQQSQTPRKLNTKTRQTGSTSFQAGSSNLDLPEELWASTPLDENVHIEIIRKAYCALTRPCCVLGAEASQAVSMLSERKAYNAGYW